MDHIEDELNRPIKFKNEQTLKELREYKEQRKRNTDQGISMPHDKIGRFKMRMLPQILLF